ncbi:uncharacterized protein TNCV_3263481 [Trichonephila clavipes]|nr:uncharacterized protein TNCV_3263481 [Trichonephila clavipes]
MTEHGNADFLSRFPKTSEELEDKDDITILQMSQIEALHVTSKELRQETGKDIELGPLLRTVGKSGLAITFVLKCFACPYRVEFSSSNFHEGTQFAIINTRFVYAMRSIGKGAEAGRMFCGVMNLPQPPTRFSPYGKRILNAAKLVYEDSIQNAAKEAICENEGNKNIAVAVDGTWQKRGYTSLNGVVTVTSIDTGKVINVDILSKYCACKNLPFHEKDCKRNYVGSSGAMEIQGASKIFQRSLSLHNADILRT